MLRILVAALLAANIGFLAWSQGWLDGVVGARSIGDREPERLAHQVHPETIRVLPPVGASAASAAASEAASAASAPDDQASGSDAKADPKAAAKPASSAASGAPATPLAEASAPAALVCLEAGPFSDAELVRVQAQVKTALAGASVDDRKSVRPGRYLVYMGPYPSAEALAKKEEELKRRKLSYSEVQDNSPYAPGLALGRYGDRASATRALEQFGTQDIHTARVVELAPPSTGHTLHLETADIALAGRAGGLKLGAAAKGFQPCAAKA